MFSLPSQEEREAFEFFSLDFSQVRENIIFFFMFFKF